jgi:two-component system chemotaxis response regulator CheB
MESQSPWIVAIGASGTQGLMDIRILLHQLPPTLPAVVMVVLHRPWNAASRLGAVLAQSSAMPVVTAGQGQRLAPGTVYIGEPGAHLTLAARTFGGMAPDPHRIHRNRTVDLLFRSLAKHAGPRSIGIVLSGSLDDGSRGLVTIKEAGGLSMVMTPRRFERGMPENAIAFDGRVDLIGEPALLADGVCAAIRNASLSRAHSAYEQ